MKFRSFCNHPVGLVEALPAVYGSAMLAPLVKPPQAYQCPVLAACVMISYHLDLNLTFHDLTS